MTLSVWLTPTLLTIGTVVMVSHVSLTRSKKRRSRESELAPPSLVHKLIPKIEALDCAQEPQIQARLTESLQGSFREVLMLRGLDPSSFQLELPRPGEMKSISVRRADGRVWALYEFDDQLDELAQAS